jgi:uncharacterized membrane protein
MVSSSSGKMTLLLTSVLAGAFVMLNTWDLPTVMAILAGVWLISAVLARRGRASRSVFMGLGGALAILLGGALLLYLPFLVGFRSQAEGIRFTLFRTPPQQYLLMFGLFLLVLVPLALSQVGHMAGALRAVRGRTAALVGGMLLIDAALLFLLLQANLPDERLGLIVAISWVLVPLVLTVLLDGQDATPLAIAQVSGLPLLAGLLLQQWTLSLIAALLALTLLVLWSRVRDLVPALEEETAPEALPAHPIVAGGSHAATVEDVVIATRANHRAVITLSPGVTSLLFALGLTAMSLLLTMGSEIFYIKDGFPGRMNTVFKLYYQAWTLMSVASVFGLVYLIRRMPRAASVPWMLLVGLLAVGSLWYPVEALQSKADFDGPAHWDGRFWMQGSDPDRFAAIEWLNSVPGQVVIVERVGDQYNAAHSALAGWTGHSTLVGWAGHELQWRGTYDEVARREPVIAEIYQSTDPERARDLIDEWGIDYVALTPFEIERYSLAGRQIEKFRELMTPAFQQGSVTIFGR